eukprot:scaffold1918_cov154-Amphora_coffeaeformis.AAC.15
MQLIKFLIATALVVTAHAQDESITSQVKQPEAVTQENEFSEKLQETSQSDRDLGYYKKSGKMGGGKMNSYKGHAYEPWMHAPVPPPVPPPTAYIHYFPKTHEPYAKDYYGYHHKDYYYKGSSGKMGGGKMNSYKEYYAYEEYYPHDDWFKLPKTHEPYAKDYYHKDYYYKGSSGKMNSGKMNSYKEYYAHDEWYKLPKTHEPYTKDYYHKDYYHNYKGSGKMGGGKMNSYKEYYYADPWVHAPVPPPVPPQSAYIHYYPKTVDPYYPYSKGKGYYGGKMYGGKMSYRA